MARAAACSRGSPTCCNSARRWSSPVEKRDADVKTNWMEPSSDLTSLSAGREKTEKQKGIYRNKLDFKFILKQENNVDDSLKETSRRSFPSSQTQSRIEPFAMANFSAKLH